ncbi:phosphodiester glycosidase family protein [Treponema pectinovorum]|uniref:phosphodiester glycosidase family protein n=1 Tax=Treponema pectinovorum TaxID=164 RepID=UPI0011CA419D|nr:phosphodiester glycosidase family protein [Treponema pectinovorum]
MIKNHFSKKNKQIAFKFLIASFVFLFWSCASLFHLDRRFSPYQKESYIPQNIEWQAINRWAEHFVFRGKEIPLIYHLVKIDLSSKELKISGYPNDSTKKRAISAKKLSKLFSTGIFVNTNPYTVGFSPKKIIGIHKIEGEKFADEAFQYSALAFKKEDDGGFSGRIIENQKEDEFLDFDYAFGGFFTILKDGKKRYFYETRDSRSAGGLSADGKILYILAVEGENHKKSLGLSYPECADIFLELGATDALEFDGGGSTSLFIDGKNILSYGSIRKNAAYVHFFTEQSIKHSFN